MLAPVRLFGSPLLDGIDEVAFPAPGVVVTPAAGRDPPGRLRPLYPPGLQLYWRTDFFRELNDDALAVHERFAEVPTPLSTIHLYPLDAAAHQVGSEDTAFRHRDATWAGVILGADPDPAKTDMIRDWSVRYWDELHPTSVGSRYVNHMMTEGQDRVEATYGENFDRLARIKAVYAPDDFFRVQQNIPPAG